MRNCRSVVFALAAVVVDLYAEHYGRRYGGDGVGYYQRPVGKHQALDYEKHAAGSEQKECGHGYAVGVAGAYGVESLGKIAANHADGGGVAYDVEKKLVVHNCDFSKRVESYRGPVPSTAPVPVV